MFRGLAKLLIFAAILVAGIVFLSDGFMARVGQGVFRVESYVRGVLDEKAPAINQDFSVQTRETTGQINDLYKNISWSAWNNFKNWTWQKISGAWQSFGK